MAVESIPPVEFDDIFQTSCGLGEPLKCLSQWYMVLNSTFSLIGHVFISLCCGSSEVAQAQNSFQCIYRKFALQSQWIYLIQSAHFVKMLERHQVMTLLTPGYMAEKGGRPRTWCDTYHWVSRIRNDQTVNFGRPEVGEVHPWCIRHSTAERTWE